MRKCKSLKAISAIKKLLSGDVYEPAYSISDPISIDLEEN